jgi:hypothetical protein
MQNKILFSVLLLTVPFIAFSQKNLKPATLVTANNETLKGLVDDQEWFGNPTAISFKPEGAAAFKKYTAQEAVSVTIEKGGRYVSRTVTIDQTNDRQLEVDERLDSSYLSSKTVTVFLKAELLSDKINLYSVTDFKQHLFVDKPGLPTRELVHRKYRVRRSGKIFEEEDKTFTDLLGELLADCPDLAEKQFDTEFTLEEVSRQLRKYIICTEGKTNYQKKQSKGKLALGALAGTAIQSFRFTGQPVIGASALYNQSFSGQPAILAGLRAQYLIPARQQKLSLIADLYYTRYKGSAEKVIAYTNPTFYTTRKVAVDFSMLRTDLLFRYAILPKNGFSAFANVGISFNKPMGDNSTTTDTEVFNTTTTITTKGTFAASGGLRNIIMQTTGGAGVAYNQYSLEYRFYKTGRIANGVFYPVDYKAHQLMVCYRFK